MAIETADKGSILITRATSTKIGLTETKRNRKLFISKMYEMNLIELFDFFKTRTIFTLPNLDLSH